MNLKYCLLSLLVISSTVAITETEYTNLCGGGNLSRQGQRFCKKHAKRIGHKPTQQTLKVKSLAKTSPKKASNTSPEKISFKEQRLANKPYIKPYVPGGYTPNGDPK